MAPAAPAGAQRLCRLAAAIGQTEACPEAACAFWEPGGAVLAGRCAFERLDVSAKPELASMLLDTRHALESARSRAEARDLRRRVSHLLNEDEDAGT